MMNKVDFLGYKFDVVEVEDKLDSSAMATIDFQEHKIYVEKSWNELAKLEAIIHEGLEFVNKKFELGMVHNQIQAVSFSITSMLLSMGLFTAKVFVPSPKKD